MSLAERAQPPTPSVDVSYQPDPDPWQVTTSWYVQRKLAIVLACLPRATYRTAWEPGCGPGVVSEVLADRVDSLLATDSSPVAVRFAQQRCRERPQVSFAVSEFPEVPVTAPVELVVVSEFLYYLRDLPAALDALWSAVAPGGHIAFLHWAHQPEDAYSSGPQTHADIAIDSVDREAARVVTHADSDFLLDIYEAPHVRRERPTA